MRSSAGDHATTCVALDFETSGYAAHSACAVGLARIAQGRVVDTLYSRIRPPSSRILFTHIHGLTWPMLKDAPPFARVWQQMAAFMEGADALLAHNAPFDRRVLYASCLAVGIPCPALPFFCTLRGVRRCHALSLPSYTLSAVCAHFNIPLQHHHAVSDAVACAAIYLRLRGLGMTDAQMRI